MDLEHAGRPDRLIELKSSGVNATMQTMTWNEWKTARDSHLRQRYYLYLVGNLRSDLASAEPFVRAINDPYRDAAEHRTGRGPRSTRGATQRATVRIRGAS